ncbi:hypothetical protein [Streptomyces sp. UNOB3_S3]|uniref:hypothetical protein n=1 Tax=Streptomyces sp. UNOB3_S3 TaxID=2871682 RepID=UPI001E2989F2|nr:hypothetical protein [Streptomyces sp. UNOB3_S3]MCC3775249.1 hypothetical protein [Streptomyces sp. UNOB3_S3]
MTAWYWNGEIRAFDFRGERQYAEADPTDDFRVPTAIGLVATPLSLAFLWSAYWLARRSAKSPRRTPWQTSVPNLAAFGIAAAGAPFGYFQDTMEGALRWTGYVAVPIVTVAAAVMVWNVFRDRRKETDTVEVVPLIPTREKVFVGVITGDVPYSKEGFHTLVAGPGLLATTVDPTGHVLRTTVPGTLVVERVRPVYRTDPSIYRENVALVAECRDGDKRVLILAAAEHMGWVLGALLPDGPPPVGAPPEARPAAS